MIGRRKIPLARFAWAVVAVNLGVILWGAVVRATGSGAGCGSHWPLCNGEIVPRAARAATLIEFGHRVTSGLALLAVVALAFVILRAARDPERAHALDPTLPRLAWYSLAFMLGEAAIGAGIVLLELVGENASLMRAGWMAVHLLNTFLLLGTLTMIADRADGTYAADAAKRAETPTDTAGADRPRRSALTWSAIAGLGALLATGASGAVAALGDTLFPATSLAAGLAHDLDPGASFLVRLRTLHPLVAIAAGLFWLHLAQNARRGARDPGVRQATNAVTLLIFLQLAVGLLNLGLLAPVALQLVHLLLADLVWIAAVVLIDRQRVA